MTDINRVETAVIAALLVFLMVNFNPQLAMVYSTIAIFTIILKTLDTSQSITTQLFSKKKLQQDFITGAGGYIVFLIASFAVLSSLNLLAGEAGVLSLIGLQAQAQPIFQGSQILEIFTIGVLSPILENDFFFNGILEIVEDKSKGKLTIDDPRTWGVAILFGLLFLTFHFTAKGIPGNIGDLVTDGKLMMTFVFGTVMTLMVVWSKNRKEVSDVRPSIITHQIANLTAKITQFI